MVGNEPDRAVYSGACSSEIRIFLRCNLSYSSLTRLRGQSCWGHWRMSHSAGFDPGAGRSNSFLAGNTDLQGSLPENGRRAFLQDGKNLSRNAQASSKSSVGEPCLV